MLGYRVEPRCSQSAVGRATAETSLLPPRAAPASALTVLYSVACSYWLALLPFFLEVRVIASRVTALSSVAEDKDKRVFSKDN